jgi:hypothetical protein
MLRFGGGDYLIIIFCLSLDCCLAEKQIHERLHEDGQKQPSDHLGSELEDEAQTPAASSGGLLSPRPPAEKATARQD